MKKKMSSEVTINYMFSKTVLWLLYCAMLESAFIVMKVHAM
jgi:hypothetical protein